MSFCNEVKSELAVIKTHKCCLRAVGMGLSVALKSLSDSRAVLRTEQADTAMLAASRLSKLYNQECETKVSANGKLYTVTLRSEAVCNSLKAGRMIDMEHICKPCCVAAFIRGVFLSCGHMVDPKKNYRLDFLMPDERLADTLCQLLSDNGFTPKRSKRNNGSVCVYFIDSTSIEDLLTFMGAINSSLTLMEIKVEKNYTNALNRRGNFDTANYVKTYAIAQAQIAAIERLKECGKFGELSDDLREIADLRLEYTDATLNELAALSHLGRSTVDRRLKKIMQLSEEINTRR